MSADASATIIAAARGLEPLIEAGRAEMDAERRLSRPVVEALQAMGALRQAVPIDLNGPQLDPITQVRVVEEVSRLDGSVGWCVMIAAASSFVSGFLSPAAAQRWFGPPDACLAGQLAPAGRADKVDGGYRVTGRFRFASGSGHATMLLGGCLVWEGDEPLRKASGAPVMRSVLFRPDQCRFIDTWHTTGLWATGSNDYEVSDLYVAEEDSWDPAGAMQRTEPLYAYPPLFLAPHAGVPLGIGRAALDSVFELVSDKEIYPTARKGGGKGRTVADEESTQETLAWAEGTLGAARAFTYATLEELWSTLQAGERVSPRQRAIYRIMMTQGHQAAKDVISRLYDLAASSAIYRGNPLERHMRDILTACQHRMVHPRIYRPAGRILMGRDSGDPLV